MTFEQLLKKQIKSELEDRLASDEMTKDYSITLANDFNFNFGQDLTNRAVGVIATGSGTPLALQGTLAVTQTLSMTFLVKHNQLQEWLDIITKYVLSKIAVPSVLTEDGEQVFEYSVNYNTPSVLVANNMRGLSTISVTGSFLYTDSLRFGGTVIKLAPVDSEEEGEELVNIVSLQASSNVQAESTTPLASFQTSAVIANSDTLLVITISLNIKNELHKKLARLAINPTAAGVQFRLEINLFGGVETNYNCYLQSAVVSSQTGAFDTLQLTLVRSESND